MPTMSFSIKVKPGVLISPQLLFQEQEGSLFLAGALCHPRGEGHVNQGYERQNQ